MDSYDAATYGDRIADVYDDWHGGRDPGDTVDVLAGLAGSGPALELGIGTGRVALPLAERGIAVHGVEGSAAMVAKMRLKPGGDDIPVVIGDFGPVPVEGEFSLVFAVFASFYGLLTQEAQVACFRNVAEHLTADGVFVVETFVPDPTRFSHGQTVATNYIGVDNVELVASKHDPVSQRISSQKVRLTEKGVRLCPVEIRYVWPPELDLMAQLAGLRLRERWAGWSREAFGPSSREHVSVYERAGD